MSDWLCHKEGFGTMNEKEVKDAARERRSGSSEARCSVTGRSCECLAGGGCKNREPLLDRCPDEVIRWVAVAHLRIDGVREALLAAQDAAGGLRRRYPLPEAREWRRRLEALQEEIASVLS